MNQHTYDELYIGNNANFTSLISIAGTLMTLTPLVPDEGTTEYIKLEN
ncbi:hypothetical protein [Mucilaginibacter ginsenosidivorans]|nr:hypothetical protein [Mucilaginibacter ginsenosidivorans]